MSRRLLLGIRRRHRKLAMQEVREVAELGLSQEESVRELKSRLVSRFEATDQEIDAISGITVSEDGTVVSPSASQLYGFDPVSILFSILVSWAIQQLIKWIKGKLQDKTWGDDE